MTPSPLKLVPHPFQMAPAFLWSDLPRGNSTIVSPCLTTHPLSSETPPSLWVPLLVDSGFLLLLLLRCPAASPFNHSPHTFVLNCLFLPSMGSVFPKFCWLLYLPKYAWLEVVVQGQNPYLLMEIWWSFSRSCKKCWCVKEGIKQMVETTTMEGGGGV